MEAQWHLSERARATCCCAKWEMGNHNELSLMFGKLRLRVGILGVCMQSLSRRCSHEELGSRSQAHAHCLRVSGSATRLISGHFELRFVAATSGAQCTADALAPRATLAMPVGLHSNEASSIALPRRRAEAAEYQLCAQLSAMKVRPAPG